MTKEEFQSKFNIGDKIRKSYWETGEHVNLSGFKDQALVAFDELSVCLEWDYSDDWELHTDPQTNPDDSHYRAEVEPINLIEAHKLNFNRGSIIKYVTRAGKKDCELTDLKKAKWYLEREINKLEK